MDEMKKMTIEGFMNELASNSPAPGGGSVSALSSSLAASLASMVLNLTVGKKVYMGYDDDTKKKIDDAIPQVNALKDKFMSFMDEDTKAFNEVMAAFKLPKDTDEEKAKKSRQIQEATIKATEVPLNVARNTMKIFEYLELAATYGNPNALSDAGVGALLALTGLEGAILNVKINLPGIKDEGYVTEVTKEISELTELGRSRKELIVGMVNSKL
jgi:formiminotetrahydrofolate cyclodeaminase